MCQVTEHDDAIGKNDDEGVVVLPKPYTTLLFHPHVSWAEVFLNWIIKKVLNMDKMCSCAPNNSAETMAVVEEIDTKIIGASKPSSVKPMADKWAKLADCPIGEHICSVPVQKDILQKWNIISPEENKDVHDLIKKDEIRLIVRFPMSLLSTKNDDDNGDDTFIKEKENGFIDVENLDLSSFAVDDATTLVQFHGGGYVVGNGEQVELLGEATEVLESYSKSLESDNPRVKPLVTISVDYSNAPGYPFPNAVVEGMSAVDYLLSLNPRRKLHISGPSAGSGIALPVAMEAEGSIYAGRISSVHVHAPFIDPKADTMSYYMMANVPFIGSNWLRWCWQAYLGMDPPSSTMESKDETPSASTVTKPPSTIQELLECGSNAEAWENCKWNKEPFNRLVRPIEGISSLQVTDNSPSFLVMVNKADVLYSEGMELADRLKQKGLSVSLFEHSGLHCISTQIDPTTAAKRNKAWAEVLFETK